MRLTFTTALAASLVALATGSAAAQSPGPTAPEPAAQTPAPAQPAPAPPVAPAPAPAPGYAAETPSARALYRHGPDQRYLLAGTWLHRLDPRGVGLSQGFMRNASTEGWTRTTAPNVWNATDESDKSFKGTVGWYRKDFKLPSAKAQYAWIVRFESVNYRSRVWLNGRPLGSNRGAYLPFELRLPPSLLERGTNRLVIRVDNRRKSTDFPPSNLNPRGRPTGGWWNYGGLTREVYLRRVDAIDFSQVVVRPDLACATCAASVLFRVTARNFAPRAVRTRLTASFGGQRVSLGTAGIGPRGVATFTRRVTVNAPRLWSPDSPALYDVNIVARVGKRVVRRHFLQTGIRSIKVSQGRLLLNGRQLNVRGVGMHEDSLVHGFAQTNAERDKQLADIKDLGATLIRAHYPLHPYMQERADQLGLLQWSEIPVYSVRNADLKKREVRVLAAKELEDNIVINGNHPSVLVWSIGNELSSKPGPVQGFYIQRAVRAAKQLDPSRPVGLAVAGYPSAGCQPEYGPLDIIGVNTYFGWYPGPNGQIADRTLLSGYLDSVRACYPDKALMITEFGAEANREGPVEEKGTYAFQSDWAAYTLGVAASKPWLSGAIYWASHEFRVRPDWEGGNPRPSPPIHQKGLITLAGERKPAFTTIQQLFRSTVQLRGGRRR